MEEKYYIAYQNAEDQSSGIVCLTDEEHKTVKKFLSQVHSFSGGYCETCGIEDKSFPSVEEAQNALYNEENDDADYIEEIDYMISEMMEKNFTCK